MIHLRILLNWEHSPGVRCPGSELRNQLNSTKIAYTGTSGYSSNPVSIRVTKLCYTGRVTYGSTADGRPARLRTPGLRPASSGVTITAYSQKSPDAVSVHSEN
jgi:hypothetical protein